ncbi:unnamed protein product [Chondrus crispus]|uniref:Uncharacterized protein n=1 Tax=Chondrus crispus TaxID=2769 RepID=R7QMK4_CHOCR|nr:unnamed protein product [Chondrus crispus]CDF39747.1 unnamed protein product [Chondrus crispus]|eukprot:XP_005710041.1 unnamed protein product [Chondrus crispus]
MRRKWIDLHNCQMWKRETVYTELTGESKSGSFAETRHPA